MFPIRHHAQLWPAADQHASLAAMVDVAPYSQQCTAAMAAGADKRLSFQEHLGLLVLSMDQADDRTGQQSHCT